MGDKAPQKPSGKKPGKSLKEKRAQKNVFPELWTARSHV